MVKPERQELRKSNLPSNSIAHNIPDYSPQHPEVEPELTSAIKEDRASKEIVDAFLECYSNFVGTDLNDKTVWKSETFNRTLESD